jgi:hypothetical protein
LLGLPGWKKLKAIATRLQREQRDLGDFSIEVLASKQAKGPVIQFGIQVPRNVKEAYDLDKRNSNTNWHDAMEEEIDSLLAYSTFHDGGHIKFLPGYKNFHVQIVFAVKHDLHHIAGLVAGGHLTDPNTTDIKYSSVVSFLSIQISIVAGKLNILFLMVGDISFAYIEGFTNEKVYFIAGPEVGPLAGNLLTIERAIYGLRTSGARRHDRYQVSPIWMPLFVKPLLPNSPLMVLMDLLPHFLSHGPIFIMWYFLMPSYLTVPAISRMGAIKKLTKLIPIEIFPVVIPTISVHLLLLL